MKKAPLFGSPDESPAATSLPTDKPSADQLDVSCPPEKCSPWLLFALPIGLGLLLSLFITLVNVFRSIDTKAIYLGLDGLRSIILGGLIALVFVGTLLCWLRPKLRTLLAGTAMLAVLGFTASKLVRIESFYGNMVPRLAWAWTPLPEEEVEAYFVARKSGVDERPLTSVDFEDAFFSSGPYDFPGFLGPNRDAKLQDVHLDPDWGGRPPRLLWRHPVGLGWSSFAIQGRAAVNLEQRSENECVVCYDLLSGREIWSHSEYSRFEDEHGDGPRSTPTIAGDRVYSMGANGILTCLELASGQLIWRQETLTSPSENLLWGMSGSPLFRDGKIYVTPGGSNSAAICYDALDGTEIWRAGDDPGAYASPFAAKVCGQQLILSFNGAGLRAFTPGGSEEWLFPWLTQGELQRVNVAQPVLISESRTSVSSASQILISSGYGNGTALISIEQDENGWSTETIWHSNRLKSKMSNFVVHGDSVYGLDSGILTCLDLTTGDRRWKRGRYGHGQILMVGDYLLIQTESGQVVLVEATPKEHRELASFQALDGKTWNNPALTENVLVVRNNHEAAAYELPLVNNRIH